ncbi:MAG TPA: sensor histidine kinase [Opitutaceae bacterium]|nr:sensor histidine kinase [Opitutaceae bacterium]
MLFFLRFRFVRATQPLFGRSDQLTRVGSHLLALGFCALLAISSASAAIRGMPFRRSYSLEDIGFVPRGALLDFDRFGRVAVIHDGVYAVLNDTSWLNISGRETDRIAMLNVVNGADGRMYYGGRASWGLAELRSDGLLHAVPLVPDNPPDWVRSATFDQIFSTEEGIYFVGSNGAVFWDTRRKAAQYYDHPRIARGFQLGNRIYISAFDRKLCYINIDKGLMEEAPPTELDHNVVTQAALLDSQHALLALLDGDFVVFDGQRTTPWEPQAHYHLTGSISAIQRLTDGSIALARTGAGLYLFSAKGELLLTLDTSEFKRITALANREPGVLWVATENGIEKVLYSSSLTAFGQPLGLTVGWPVVEQWRGNIYVVSEGNLYVAVQGSPGAPSHFELYPQQPEHGVWAVAASGPHMLVGGPDDVYSVADDGTLRFVTRVTDLAHLVMYDDSHCYAIGRRNIGFLEWQDGKWVETISRIGGVSYPSVVHRVGKSVWIELAGQFGRLTCREGRLALDIIPNTSWTSSPWVNIGVIDNIAVLAGNPGQRRFFDEAKGDWVDAPEIAALLNRSPIWISRVQKDESGTIWATHDDGVVRFTPQGTGFEVDTSTFDFINDRYPQLYVLPGNDIWICASRSLYHVEKTWPPRNPEHLKPILVSLKDSSGAELLTGYGSGIANLRLPYRNNNLSFRFFSGTYADRRPPNYEYRLLDHENWTAITGSQLNFRGLHDGEYTLHVRILERPGAMAEEIRIPFDILSPWYRTWPAYVLFGTAAALGLLGAVRWSIYIERKRNIALEKVIDERTHQLRDAMTKLGEKTRNAAVLAERNRLANEIHDSVQQGLTGAILQLDTTLKQHEFSGNLRNRLDVVRNMISYARQEVQHAVWDMESPLLEKTQLAAALQNLITFINADLVAINVKVSGKEIPLGRTASHNLLRIAQEATTNAIRHASAQHIDINLNYTTETVELTIIDDGVGFSPNEVLHNRTGHLGLRGIRTRVKKLQGKLTIDSAPNRGTAIRIQMPVSQDALSEPIL